MIHRSEEQEDAGDFFNIIIFFNSKMGNYKEYGGDDIYNSRQRTVNREHFKYT